MKRFIYILIALAFAGGVGYYISLEMEKLRKDILAIEQGSGKRIGANEYQGWKTYSNDELEFSFKYPPDWNIEAKEMPTSGFTVNVSPGKLSDNIFANIVSIYEEGPGIGCVPDEELPSPTKKEFEVGGAKELIADFCNTKTSWVLPVNLGGKAQMANIFVSFGGYTSESQTEARLIIKSLANTKYRFEPE